MDWDSALEDPKFSPPSPGLEFIEINLGKNVSRSRRIIKTKIWIKKSIERII